MIETARQATATRLMNMNMDPDDGNNNASQQDAGVLVMPNTGAVRYLPFSSFLFFPSPPLPSL